MGRVSLIGALLAKPGAEYVFRQRCEVADRCPVATTCQNLEVGRRYKITTVRNVKHAVCTEHEEGVQAVEVEVVPRIANVPERSLRGTRIRWEPPVCNQRGCPQWNVCFDPSLVTGSEQVVEGPQSPVVCLMGYNLRRVQLKEPATPGGPKPPI